jgi:hypothetical protein
LYFYFGQACVCMRKCKLSDPFTQRIPVVIIYRYIHGNGTYEIWNRPLISYILVYAQVCMNRMLETNEQVRRTILWRDFYLVLTRYARFYLPIVLKCRFPANGYIYSENDPAQIWIQRSQFWIKFFLFSVGIKFM